MRKQCDGEGRGIRRAVSPRRLAALRNERGQALVETGIVITLFVTLTLGLIEFGRTYMVANMITHAARDGARAAAVVPTTSRNSSGIINGGTITNIQNQVITEIQNVLSASDASSLTATLTQPQQNGLNVVQMNVSGTVPYLFNLVGTSFAVNRTVVFRDEGR